MIRKLVHGGEQVIDGLAIREDFGGAGGGAGRRGDRYLLIALAFGLETEIFVLSLGVIPKRAHREISAGHVGSFELFQVMAHLTRHAHERLEWQPVGMERDTGDEVPG